MKNVEFRLTFRSGSCSPHSTSRIRHSAFMSCLASVVLFLSLTPTLGQVLDYQASPIDFHRKLREAFIAGDDVSADINTIIEKVGDHSFDTLLTHSQSKLTALNLRSVAWKAWSEGDYAQAIRLYRKAAKMLGDSGASSGVAFCLYFIGEIFAEQENYVESLRWLERAIEVASSKNGPYLEALLLQSKGYSLWFMDHLQASIHAFSLALERWKRIGFRAGMVTSWNNLASLYEELRLWKKADHCYKRALRITPESLDEEIRFYLHANYALFLHKAKQLSKALHHLDKARELKGVSPEKFLLLELKVLGLGGRSERLHSFHPQLPSLRIERALLLGQFFQKHGDKPQAYRYFKEAFLHSQSWNQRYFIRTSALHLGTWLENDGQYREAAELYSSTFNQEHNLSVPEVVFPYSRAISPLFDGWIRCLIRLGRFEEAWREIQRLVELRRNKGEKVTESLLPAKFSKDEVGQFIMAGKLETQTAPAISWEKLTPSDLKPKSAFKLLSSQVKDKFTIVEMWPDRTRVYAWLIQSSGYLFRELILPKEIAETVQEIVDPLYSAGDALPPAPTAHHLQLVYSYLIQPLEKFFDSHSILFIGHKELQYLPIEMLQNWQGEFLLQRYNFSYLPSAYRPQQQESSDRLAPTLIVPASSLVLPEVEREEIFFKTLFPDLKVIKRLDTAVPTSAKWIHLSTHFRLDDRFWLVSGFASGAEEVNILRFLKGPFSCTLLSLGVCDAGNGYTSGSPYWLGFCELFLTRGVNALIVNRWRLDELSSRIYRDFYSLSKRGLSMDQAITEARRTFLAKSLKRANVKIRGDHPFFWAGIAYVGVPGKSLYERPEFGAGILLCGLSLGIVVLSVFLSAAHSRRRRKTS
ncbi:CHAT domain-containing tetratricopeptide repeat protein [Acidobacteria bacterium AH-259-G07]|nr:CHAT domain-containing tetratricopeptide repeat protein [Acidobacteria bacterium AH-259-G07]